MKTTIPVEFNPFLPAGSGVVMMTMYGPQIVFRHPSEWLLSMTGATWHVSGHCPTWTDADECRCMLGGDA